MKIKDLIDNFSSDDIAGLESNVINNPDYNWSSEQNSYLKDWQEISTIMKIARSYTCSECGWKPKSESEKRYIHTHHKNRDKENNSSFNLEVLCFDCHHKNHPKFQNNSEHKKFLALRAKDQLEISEKTVSIGNLMFQDSDLPDKMNWNSACEYCEKLKLLGFSDWRLPTKDELLKAYENRSQFKNIKDSYYWSVTEYDSSGSWIVYFDNGFDGWSFQTSSLYAVCVRDL